MLALSLALLSLFVVLGCSDDDDPTSPPPPEDTVATVTVTPDSAALTARGETAQFSAVARDADGEIVYAAFVWSTTDENVATVSSYGLVTAQHDGEVEVIALAEGVADTSLVTVDIEHPETAVSWKAATSGDWNVAENWSGGVVPTSADSVVIGLPGDYTVTMDVNVNVAMLTIGHDTGTQTLATGAHTLTLAAAELNAGGVIQNDLAVTIIGSVMWYGGAITGDGLVTVNSAGELVAYGDESIPSLECDLRNDGVVAMAGGGVFAIVDCHFENPVGGLFEFRSDSYVDMNYLSSFNNDGTIRKSGGDGNARLSSTIGTFTTQGPVEVLTGTFTSNGAWASDAEIAAGATLEFSGSSEIAGGVSFGGEGTVHFALSSHRIGADSGDVVSFRHLLIDEYSPTLFGPGDIAVSDSLVWHRGYISNDGELQIGPDAVMRIASNNNRKYYAGNLLRVAGKVETGGSLDLRLDDDAVVLVESGGVWEQDRGGTIQAGYLSDALFEVAGTFTKLDGTATNIEANFHCSGLLELYYGVTRFTHDFWLMEDGVFRGGGPDAISGNNVRLRVIDATSAIIDGTVDLDFEGAPSWLDIHGSPTFSESASVLIDMPGGDGTKYERLSFQGSPDMSGDLVVNRTFEPESGDSFLVLSKFGGSSNLVVTGAEGFDVSQDETSVRLDWQAP